jgi:hypothetical protein
VGLEHDAIQQGDEADEGRLEARRSMVVGAYRGRAVIVNGRAGARPLQLIASVRPTMEGSREVVGRRTGPR